MKPQQFVMAIPLSELQACENCQMATPREVHGNCGMCGSQAVFAPMEILERNQAQMKALALSRLLDSEISASLAKM